MKTAFAVVLCALLLPGPCAGIGRNLFERRSPQHEAMGPKQGITDQNIFDVLAERTVTAMQWSPHWMCFGPFSKTCAPVVEKALPAFFEEYDIDFANIGMMNEASANKLKFAGEFESLVSQCPEGDNFGDKVDLIYNANKWEKVSQHKGCLDFKTVGEKQVQDRAFVTGVFERKESNGDKILVIGSHFPHPVGGTSSDSAAIFKAGKAEMTAWRVLALAVSELLETHTEAKVLLIGDFNYDMPGSPARESMKKLPPPIESNDTTDVSFVLGQLTPRGLISKTKGDGKLQEQPSRSNEALWGKMSGQMTTAVDFTLATEQHGTCCADQTVSISDNLEGKADIEAMRAEGVLNEKKDETYFPFAFDRVLSGFGTEIETIYPLGPDTSVHAVPTRKVKAGEYEIDLTSLFVGAFHKPIIGKISY